MTARIRWLSRELLGLLRNVSGWKRSAFPEEKVFHVLGDQLLRLFLPGHEPVFVEDHLHPILPELPCLRGDVLVDALAELAWPGGRVESGQLFLEFLAHDHPPALVANGWLGRGGTAGISHADDCSVFAPRSASAIRSR